MRPNAVRCSHAHGSASRRRSNFVTARPHKQGAPATTPAEKHAHEAASDKVSVTKAA